MDSLQVLRACARRWYVSLPFVVLSAAVVVIGWERPAPTYVADAGFGLVPVSSQREVSAAKRVYNPLAPEGDVRLLGEAVTNELMSAQVQGSVDPAARGYPPNTDPADTRNHAGTHFDVRSPTQPHIGRYFNDEAAPLKATYLVSSWADTPAQAEHAVSAALADAATAAQRAQDSANVATAARYKVLLVSNPSVSEVSPSEPLKNLSILAIVGVLAAAAASVLVDRRVGGLRRTAAANQHRRTRSAAARRPEPIRVANPTTGLTRFSNGQFTSRIDPEGLSGGHGDARPRVRNLAPVAHHLTDD